MPFQYLDILLLGKFPDKEGDLMTVKTRLVARESTGRNPGSER